MCFPLRSNRWASWLLWSRPRWATTAAPPRSSRSSPARSTNGQRSRPLPVLSAGCWRYLEQLRSLRSLRCSKLQGEGNFRQTQERVYCQTSSVSGFLPQREPQRWNPRSSFPRWEPHLEACSLETQPETSPNLYLFFFIFTFCVIPKCPFQSLIEHEMLFFLLICLCSEKKCFLTGFCWFIIFSPSTNKLCFFKFSVNSQIKPGSFWIFNTVLKVSQKILQRTNQGVKSNHMQVTHWTHINVQTVHKWQQSSIEIIGKVIFAWVCRSNVRQGSLNRSEISKITFKVQLFENLHHTSCFLIMWPRLLSLACLDTWLAPSTKAHACLMQLYTPLSPPPVIGSCRCQVSRWARSQSLSVCSVLCSPENFL